jgi:hypothetical protein
VSNSPRINAIEIESLFDALLKEPEAWPGLLERLPSFARLIDELLAL